MRAALGGLHRSLYTLSDPPPLMPYQEVEEVKGREQEARRIAAVALRGHGKAAAALAAVAREDEQVPPPQAEGGGGAAMVQSRRPSRVSNQRASMSLLVCPDQTP